MSSTWKRFRSALVGLAVVLPAGSLALADAIDPALPRTVVVGNPRGAAPSDRFDPQRTGRAHTRLPSRPVEAWRRHVNGGIDHAPLVDAQGNIHVALTIPEVIKLSPDAKELWRARLGNAAAPVPPTLTSDGTLAVVTSAGMAWGFAANGAVRFTTALGIRGRDIETAPLALADGGLAIAGGNVLVELDRDGAVRARTSLDPRASGSATTTPERTTGALLAGPEGTIITTDSGSVYTWRPPAAPRRIGTFGGSPRRGAMLADSRTLFAVIDARRVVALDLRTGLTHVRSGGGGGVFFDGPVTLGPQAAPNPGTLGPQAARSRSSPRSRASSSRSTPPATRRSTSPSRSPRSPPTLARSWAAASAASFRCSSRSRARPSSSTPTAASPSPGSNGRVGILTPEGRVELAGERVCSAPVALVPAGEKRLLLACKDGGLFMYSP